MTSLLLKVFLVLLLAADCFAASPAVLGTTSLGPDDVACSFSNADADTFAESFEGSNNGYDNTSWTETVAGSSTVEPDAAHSGTFVCTDKCSDAIQLDYDGSNTCKTIHGHTAKSTAFTQVYFNVVAEGLSDNESQAVIAGRGSTDNALWVVYLYQDVSGNRKLAISYRASNDTLTAFGTLSATISTGEWHRLGVKWDSASNGYFYLDGTQIGATFACDTEDQATIQLGSNTVLETLTIQFDNLKIDDDTMPGVCP